MPSKHQAIKLRHYAPGDLDAVLQCGGILDEWELDAVLRSQTGFCVIAHWPSSEVAGFALYDLYDKRGVLLDVAVKQPYRRQKIGSQLLGRCWVGPKSRTVAEVPDTMLEMHLFLKAVGFRAERIIQGDGCDLYRFVRR